MAIGPASWPPVLALISRPSTPFRITATAYCGSSAGAKAMIQACDVCGSPVGVELGRAGLGRGLDAVGELQAARPCRCCTTPTISVVSVSAVGRGVIGVCHTVGSVLLEHVAVVVARRGDRRTAVIISPPLATVPATIAICSGTIEVVAWPKPPMASSGRALRRWKSSTVAEEARRRRRAGRSAASGRTPRLAPVDHRLRPERERRLGERDVAAAAEDLGQRRRRTLAAEVLDRVVGLRREVLGRRVGNVRVDA